MGPSVEAGFLRALTSVLLSPPQIRLSSCSGPRSRWHKAQLALPSLRRPLGKDCCELDCLVDHIKPNPGAAARPPEAIAVLLLAGGGGDCGGSRERAGVCAKLGRRAQTGGARGQGRGARGQGRGARAGQGQVVGALRQQAAVRSQGRVW